MRWKHIRLADLGVVTTGSTPSTAKSHFYGGAIPFVTPAELDCGFPITMTSRTLSTAGAAEARMLPEDAVMVSCIGTLGKVGIAGCPVATNQQINTVAFDHSLIWPKYGYYACRLLKPKMECMAPATTLPIISKSKFQELTIPLPPLAEQKRIAGILDAADVLRAKRRESLAQLDTLLQSSFLDMFGDPVTNPMGWEQVELSSLIKADDKINYGVVQPGDDHLDGKPLIRVGDFVGGVLSTGNVKLIDPEIEKKYLRSRLNGRELLVSCVGSIGTVCKVPEEAAGFNIARAVARVPLKEDISRDFMLHCLRSEAVQRHFSKETRTVSQPTLNIALIKTAPVIQPPDLLQHRFATIVESIEKQKVSQRAHLAELDTLFASLQQRTFNGEL